MKYIVEYTKNAEKDILALSKQDANKIVAKLKSYSSSDVPMEFARALSGTMKGLFRFRIGVYRAIFHKNAKGKITILTVLKIKHRKEVYKIF